jgi:hypothetical protein
MWGAMFAVAELICVVALVVILIRLVVVLRRHRMRMFSFESWKSVPRSDWRRLMLTWRDNRVAARVFMDTAPTA